LQEIVRENEALVPAKGSNDAHQAYHCDIGAHNDDDEHNAFALTAHGEERLMHLKIYHSAYSTNPTQKQKNVNNDQH
jgi:hypothetical protein